MSGAGESAIDMDCQPLVRWGRKTGRGTALPLTQTSDIIT